MFAMAFDRVVAEAAEHHPRGVTAAYDGANNRQTRPAGGVTVRYCYQHAIGLAPIMAERNETTSQMQRYYVWTPGGRLRYAIDPANGNAVGHYHFDQVGSTLARTAANGSVTDAYAYTPYGVLLGHTGPSTQPFTYVGRYGVRAESAANLTHMRARYYQPTESRFLSKDPIGPLLGEAKSRSPYDYAVRFPQQAIDPKGTIFLLDDLIIGAGVAVIVVGVPTIAYLVGRIQGQVEVDAATGENIMLSNQLLAPQSLPIGSGSPRLVLRGTTTRIRRTHGVPRSTNSPE